MSRIFIFSTFFAIIVSIFALLQFYEYRSYRRWVRNAYPAEFQRRYLRIARTVLVLGNMLFVFQFVLRGSAAYEHPIQQYGILYPGGIFFAAVVFGFLILLARDIVRFLVYWVRHFSRLLIQLSNTESTSVAPASPEALSESRRQFLRLTGATTIGVAFGTPLVSSIASAHDYKIIRVPLRFANLPSALHGLTVAQISDVHSGVYMTGRNMMEIVELTNSLHANIVALTGDHVDSADIQIPSMQKAMKQLKSDYGIYGCLGNHDHFATADRVSGALRDIDVVMLNNAHRILTINGEQIAFVGVDDAGRGAGNFARLEAAAEGLDREMFKVLLSHRPEFFPRAKEAGMDLTLAGHTHGGQVGPEFWGINLNPAYLVTKYVRGLYQEDGKQLYVNVGVGMVGVPIRIVPPEITLITLERA